ncbi:PTS sugar transporter subunit IIA [Salinivibrio socompensis]|uniref:PTS sugar transporter subunit IIA n=1 Tax=Salinivibrio socompensis TaxID=1510206 RepID=UPI000470AF37|nr:PTS sugar transporter subunit IIA [Salinivibrio socompensis]
MTGAFVCFSAPSQGLISWQVSELARLCSLFGGKSTFVNVNKDRTAATADTLSMLATGTQPNDICLLLVKGSDAELMCLVLAEYVSKHWHLYSTSAFTAAANNPLDPPSRFADSNLSVEGLHTQATQCESLFREIVERVADTDAAMQAYAAFMAREAHSSTYLGDQVALPHIIDSSVPHPAIIVTRCHPAMTWLNQESVSLCIAIAIPSDIERPILRAISRLSRRLSSSAFRRWLLHCDDLATQLAILEAVLDQA